MTRPFYVVFEGIDGSGKTLQTSLLVESLRAHLDPLQVREPTDGPCGQEIRRRALLGPPMTPVEELELFLADRRQHVEETLAPALADGRDRRRPGPRGRSRPRAR